MLTVINAGRASLLIASILLALACTSHARAAQSFSCDPSGECVCQPNTKGDCDAMKRNCTGGKISECVNGTGTHVYCFCPAAGFSGPPQSKQQKALLFKKMILKLQ
jgi:hypothetical protein